MNDPATALLVAAVLCLLGGLLLPQRLANRVGGAIPYLPGAAASALVGLAAAAILVSGQPSRAPFPTLIPETQSLVRIDPIASYFLLLLAATGLLVFGFLALTRPAGERPPALHALVLGQLAVVAAGDGALFLLGWGITLAAVAGTSTGDKAGLDRARATLTGGAVALMLLAGLMLAIGGRSGLAFTALEAASQRLAPGRQALTGLLVFACIAALAGLTPFHCRQRLANAASTGGRALAAGLITTTAIYSLIRMLGGWLHGGPGWLPLLVIAAGAAGALRGGLAALVETEIARLVHGSVGQLAGIALIGLGATLAFIAHGSRADATLAMTATLMATGSLALLAGPLVLLAGQAAAIAGSAELDAMAGLTGRAPVQSGALLIAAGGVAAIPGLGGFLPTWLGFEVLLQPFAGPAASRVGLIAGVVATAIVIAVAIASLVRLAVLLGGDPTASERRRGAPPAAAVGAAILAATAIAAYTLAAPWTVVLLDTLARSFGTLGGFGDISIDPRLVAAVAGSSRLAAKLGALAVVVHFGLIVVRRIGASAVAPVTSQKSLARRPTADSREPRVSAAGLAQPIAASLPGLYVVEETIRPVLGDAPYVPTAIEVTHVVTPLFDHWPEQFDRPRQLLANLRDWLTAFLPDLGIGYAVLVVLALLFAYA